MAVGGRGIVVHLDDAAIDELLSGPNGPVARFMQSKVAEPITKEAKRLAPVSKAGQVYLLPTFADDGAMSLEEFRTRSGHLRSQIGWSMDRDERGLYVDIASPATTPDGAPYGLFMEVGTRAHPIDSHGDYPLRNRRTGQVFGRHVWHPGTAPQPHLRPAMHAVLAAL